MHIFKRRYWILSALPAQRFCTRRRNLISYIFVSLAFSFLSFSIIASVIQHLKCIQKTTLMTGIKFNIGVPLLHS